MKTLVTGLTLLSSIWFLSAQPACEDGELSLIIEVQTDIYANETAWSVTGPAGEVYAEVDFFTYSNNTFYQTQVCVPDSSCIRFLIEDSFGDGIFSPGFYRLILEGDTIVNGEQNFFSSAQHFFGCAPGETCEEATTVGVGQYTATYDNTWYSFTPDTVGTYLISTCGLSDCDTKIWIYDTCDGLEIAEDNEGTIYYNDDENDCAPQAVVEAVFSPDETYLIRIGDNLDACPDSIIWEITYLGPVVGCTDPTACNYDPLATVSDSSCLEQGDPNCPDAPDLTIRQDVLENSIFLTTINASDPCLIEEGCIHGYGQRDIVRFTTHIDNIGELDYYIGQPTADNNQFTYDNCHNHYHYDGYAEYVLFDEVGNEIPVGFKNGFCVIDLGCDWGTPQYGCGNMGIAAGCYDIYGAGLECQWIDVTEVPDGRYVFVTRVNWDFAPDKLGRVERDSLNNWAQVCIILDRTSGTLEMSLDEECEPYLDCTGELYGNTIVDCEGICGGTTVRGDLDASGAQEMTDAQSYVTHVLGNELEPTPCNDLNGDGAITAYDASLLASCINFGESHPHEGSGAHDHCNFPSGVLNPNDTVTLSILEANFEEQYIDVGMYNPSTNINAYQFKIEGLMITEVENLVADSIYPISPLGMSGQVIGISYQDSTIKKTPVVQPLCRIHYASLESNLVCLTEVVEAVNYNQEQTVTAIVDGCVEFMPPNGTTTATAPILKHQLLPNPTSGPARITFSNLRQAPYRIELLSTDGKPLLQYEGVRGQEQQLDTHLLPAGLYTYRIVVGAHSGTGRVVVVE